MEVTNANFAAVVPEFLSLLGTCDFYSMDQEMTGIRVPGAPGFGFHAPLDAYYAVVREAATKYMAFQVGICLFHKKGDGEYEVRPFNFWLRSRSTVAPDVSLSMPAVNFHVDNGMNFSKWLGEGLSFADDATAQRIPALARGELLLQSEAQWLEAVTAEVAEWAGLPRPVEEENDEEELKAYEVLKFTMARPSVAAGRALVRRVHAAGHCCVVGYRTAERCPRKDADRQFAQTAVEADATATEQLGFRVVWEALVGGVGRGKLMVGHNFTTDLMFYLALHHSPLPEGYEDFKAAVAALFPRVADTKTYATALTTITGSGSTALGPLFKRMCNAGKFTCRLPLGFEAFDEQCRTRAPNSNAVAHQGAFDAYMTGLLHLHYLHEDVEAVRELENKISVFGSCVVMNLAGDDEACEDTSNRGQRWVSWEGPEKEVVVE